MSLFKGRLVLVNFQSYNSLVFILTIQRDHNDFALFVDLVFRYIIKISFMTSLLEY